MQGNRSQDTSAEIAVRSALHRRGLRYRVHAKPLEGLRCKADLVFRPVKVAVFIDGCFWHGCPVHGRQPETNQPYWSAKIARNIARDHRNNRVLADAGWVAIRIWEHEDPELAAERVADEVASRRRFLLT
jgi:DNA mismatch endonuclease (patch repair protein)